MKTKILSILFAIVLSWLLLGFTQQQATGSLLVTNAKTNKSINVCEMNSVQKIEAILGGAKSLNKEVLEPNEEPVYIFTYDGLTIEMQNDRIMEVTISNKKWKLNTLSVGITVAQMSLKFERSEFDYLKNPRFIVKNSKANLFAEIDEATNIVKKIRILF
ncbi:hypothetical protein [Flavobacterium sp.]|uniref:hypothetical protein n=1 Tax=Flavobacterium sp. TaxID=239 RepID=UPI00374D57B9